MTIQRITYTVTRIDSAESRLQCVLGNNRALKNQTENGVSMIHGSVEFKEI